MAVSVTCAKESGGKRLGTSGKKHRATRTSRGPFPKRPRCFCATTSRDKSILARLEKKHDKGKALSILAHTLGRAVY